MITNDELKTIIENRLYLEVEEGGFTDPNQRRIHLKWWDDVNVNSYTKDTIISSVNFSVRQKREYGD